MMHASAKQEPIRQRRVPMPILLTIMALFLSCVSSYGQETAVISGTAMDKSGAIVPGVTVTATNTATGLTRETVTGAEGTFSFASLQPGTYSIAAQAPGFSSVLIKDVVLHVRDQLTLTLNMEVGGVSQSIEVRAETARINTDSAAVGTVVDRQFVENMPLNGRSPT